MGLAVVSAVTVSTNTIWSKPRNRCTAPPYASDRVEEFIPVSALEIDLSNERALVKVTVDDCTRIQRSSFLLPAVAKQKRGVVSNTKLPFGQAGSTRLHTTA